MENPDPRKGAPAPGAPLDLASKLLILRHAAQRVVSIATGKRLDGNTAKEGELEAAIENLDNRLRMTKTETLDGLVEDVRAFLRNRDERIRQIEEDPLGVESAVVSIEKSIARLRGHIENIDNLNGEPHEN